MHYRLLLHSSASVYNGESKTYTFELDKRIDRPVKIRVQKAHYSTPTGTANPLVVYLRSDQLSSLCKSKHTLRAKNTNHRHTENILCTLGETHTVGRYDLRRDQRSFTTDPDRYIRTIDVKFSDTDTLLGNSAAAGGATGSDAEMDAINATGKLLCWTDFADSRMFCFSRG